MLPDNEAGFAPESTRKKLFTAIAESRFDSLPGVAAEYRQDVQQYLLSSEAQIHPVPLPELLKPLADALNYLRVARAHQSARFRKLSVLAVYGSPSLASKGQTVHVQA